MHDLSLALAVQLDAKAYWLLQIANIQSGVDVEGQMQGGVAQGLGWALNEEYIHNKKGRMENPGFLDYRIPVASDLPMIETIIVEVPNPKHPYGVRGVGEVGIVPPIPAVANAIHDAVGIRLREAPMSPVKVLKALNQKNGANR